MFEVWGYDKADSEMLQRVFEKQAIEKYIQGQYALGKLNEQGQRINNDKMVSFISGWMVYPNGKIRLVTPYGGA